MTRLESQSMMAHAWLAGWGEGLQPVTSMPGMLTLAQALLVEHTGRLRGGKGCGGPQTSGDGLSHLSSPVTQKLPFNHCCVTNYAQTH